jgi:hypothetical protein
MADTTRSPSIPIKRTLVVVNDFCASTTKFLNHFYTLAEDRLGEVSRQIARVETALILAESRLARVPGMEEQYLAPPTSVSLFVPTSAAVKGEGGATGAPSLLLASSLPPLPPLATAPGGVAPPPLAPGGGGSSSAPPPPPPLAAGAGAGAAGAAAPPPPPPAPAAEPPPPVPKLSEHPDYKPLFKMIQMGVPLPNVEQKARLLGLRPELLANPNAPITVVGGGGGGRDSDDGPPLPIMDAPPPPAPAPAAASLPPEYDTLIKMLKNGIPRGAVEQKARLLGLDPSLLP